MALGPSLYMLMLKMMTFFWQLDTLKLKTAGRYKQDTFAFFSRLRLSFEMQIKKIKAMLLVEMVRNLLS